MEIITYSSDTAIETLIKTVYYRKNKRICCYCEKKLIANNRSNDHFVPVCKGGADWSSNIFYCCKKCNKLKGGLMPHEFMEKVKGKIDELKEKLPSSKMVLSHYETIYKNLLSLIDNF